MLPMLKTRYNAKAMNWQLGTAGTGTVQLGIEFEVQDGEQKGERITYYGALTDAAMDFALEAARNCGWTGTDIFQEPLQGLDTNVVSIVCEPEDVKDSTGAVQADENGVVQQRLKVRWVNRAGGINMKAGVSEAAKAALGAKIRQRLAAIDAKEKRAAPATRTAPGSGNGASAGGPPPGHPAAGGAVDDIPF